MQDVTKLTVSDLKKLPTLSTGQADDLKIDTGTTRVWLARCGHPKITFERLREGRWEACDAYGVPL